MKKFNKFELNKLYRAGLTEEDIALDLYDYCIENGLNIYHCLIAQILYCENPNEEWHRFTITELALMLNANQGNLSKEIKKAESTLWYFGKFNGFYNSRKVVKKENKNITDQSAYWKLKSYTIEKLHTYKNLSSFRNKVPNMPLPEKSYTPEKSYIMEKSKKLHNEKSYIMSKIKGSRKLKPKKLHNAIIDIDNRYIEEKDEYMYNIALCNFSEKDDLQEKVTQGKKKRKLSLSKFKEKRANKILDDYLRRMDEMIIWDSDTDDLLEMTLQEKEEARLLEHQKYLAWERGGTLPKKEKQEVILANDPSGRWEAYLQRKQGRLT